ncbi:MAG: hypothetical protein ABIG29_02715 [Candidatus Nealsonbacteria bacterium]
MKFYVIVNGKLEERTWCDNPSCAYHDVRAGIPRAHIGLEGEGDKITIVSEEGKDFCSEKCAKAASSH